jgi:hypothetical protein
MGYDLYFDHTPASTTANTAAARAEFDAAVIARDTAAAIARDTAAAHDAAQDTVMAAYANLQRAQDNYFRLNIWGMGIARGLMYDYAMIYPSTPAGDFPPPPDEEYDPDDAPDPAYEAAREVYLASGVADRPGIATHKFSSNDGWHVTELECLGAVAQWRNWCDTQGHPYDYAPQDGDGDPIDWWPQWLDWLEAAGSHGGFRVR